jgi:hypothetical protein
LLGEITDGGRGHGALGGALTQGGGAPY